MIFLYWKLILSNFIFSRTFQIIREYKDTSWNFNLLKIYNYNYSLQRFENIDLIFFLFQITEINFFLKRKTLQQFLFLNFVDDYIIIQKKNLRRMNIDQKNLMTFFFRKKFSWIHFYNQTNYTTYPITTLNN